MGGTKSSPIPSTTHDPGSPILPVSRPNTAIDPTCGAMSSRISSRVVVRAEILSAALVRSAMRTGGLLYIEELNRIPEETINVLLTAMSEREISVPRLGRVAAEPGFSLVAAMNPFDAVGTARVSGALYDRTCRISMDYQPAEAEQQIVDLQVYVDQGWRTRVVALVRSTRDHPDVRFGSSVRGAIDICRLAVELAKIRGTGTDDWHVGLVAAKASLSGRIRLHDGCDRTPEEIVTDLYLACYSRQPTDEEMKIATAPFTAEGAKHRAAIEDVLWSLLNSAEFVFNH